MLAHRVANEELTLLFDGRVLWVKHFKLVESAGVAALGRQFDGLNGS